MQSIIKKIVWGCLVIIPFIALYIADGKGIDIFNWGTPGLYFPFISGKNLLFRSLVEIAFAGWALLALRDATYRVNLKKSPLTIAYAVFIIVLLVADIFGVDPTKSMWSNYERMEGFVGHIHLFAYFFVLTAMLPNLKVWQNMWKVFIVSDIAVLIYGYCQLMGAPLYMFSTNLPTKVVTWFSTNFPVHMGGNRLDSTIGNSEYYAIFCLISAFIAALLWSQTREPKRSWWYPTLIVLNSVAIFYSGTRGAIIGLMVGVVVTLIIMAWREHGTARKTLMGVLLVLVIALVTLFASKNTAFVKSSSTLYRFASISPTDLTGGSRIAIWKISYQAWLERPILGYGQDNFSYIYARKFDPKTMWNLEPWYDRSHDVFFDWLVAAGALGLITYLSLYGVALSLMWRKKSDMPLVEKALMTGVIAGYFVHNIFVFDNLTSYILFFALLAYIEMRTQGEPISQHGKVYVNSENFNLLLAPIVGILLVTILYYVNYRPFMLNRLLINGMSINQLIQGGMSFSDAVKAEQGSFTNAISYNTLGDEEAREQFLQMGVRLAQVNIPPETPIADKQKDIEAVNNFIQAIKDDITKAYPLYKDDVRMLSIYGMFYNGINDPVSAEQILTRAHTLAPKKQLISFDLIRAYLMQNKSAQAYALSREVYDSQPLFADAAKWYVLSAVYANAYVDARSHVLETGQTVPFDGDILNAVVSTKQIGLALELLTEMKKIHPELASQIDSYIKQLLAQSGK